MGGSESTATLEDSHVFKGVEKFNEYFAKASSQEQIKQLLEKVKKDIANNLNLTDSEKIDLPAIRIFTMTKSNIKCLIELTLNRNGHDLSNQLLAIQLLKEIIMHPKVWKEFFKANCEATCMDLLNQYYIEVEEIIVSDLQTKGKTSLPKPDNQKLDRIVTLYTAWSEIVNSMFDFKRIYTKSAKTLAEKYFVKCFDKEFKISKQGFKDILKLQEFIHKRFINVKMIIYFIQIILNPKLRKHKLGWNLMESAMVLIVRLCKSRLPLITSKMVEFKFISTLLSICEWNQEETIGIGMKILLAVKYLTQSETAFKDKNLLTNGIKSLLSAAHYEKEGFDNLELKSSALESLVNKIQT